MKFSNIFISAFLLLFVFACEDEKEEASNAVNCASAMVELEAANEAFESDQTKANCDKVIEKAEAAYDCMPEGPEKDEMRQDIDTIKAACVLFS